MNLKGASAKIENTIDVSVTVESAPGLRSHARKPFFFLIGSLVGGNFLSMLLRMAGSVLQARFVSPPVLGLFNGMGLVIAYAPLLHLGILDGLGRELPHAVGKDDQQRVKDLAAAAQAWAIVVGGVGGVALLLVAAWQLARGEVMLAFGWFTNAIAVGFYHYTAYLQMTYRTAHNFGRLALVGVLGNAVSLVLVVLAAWWSFYGLCWRAIIASVLSALLLYHSRPLRVGPHWNLYHLKHLLVIGAPILGVNYLYAFWSVLNSTLVLRYMGTEGMGLYAIVLMASASFELLPGAVEQVVYPRMAEQFGRTNQARDLGPIWHKPMLIVGVAMIPLSVAGWWLVEPAIRLVAPAYVVAAPAAQWSLLLPLVSSFVPVNSFFNVVRRQDLYVTAILLGMVAYGGSLFWLIRPEARLTAFPQAMLVGRAIYVSICLVFFQYLNRQSCRSVPKNS